MRKGLTLRFVRRMKNTFERAIELAERGLVDLKGLITHEFPLEEVVAAFARAEKRDPDILKAVVLL
jgi:L-iditol 2-dehydrogenase